MIRRVFVNNYDYIYLDSDMFGERKRLSTGKKSGKRMLKWYENNFDDEYKKLYEEKFGVQKKDMPTFAEYGELVIGLTSTERTEESQEEAESKLERLCKFFGNMPIDTIKATDILRWQQKCGYAPKTISNYRSILNIIFEMAYNDERINRNPIRAAKAPKIKPVKKKVFYYRDDIAKLIRAADGKLKNMLGVFLFTGVRGGELIALKWKNVDFANGILHVEDNIRDGREKSTKSEKPREIPLFKPALDALRRQQLNTGLGTYVFLTITGERYRNQDAIRKSFKKLCEKAGVEVGSLHDLRRSFNTLLKQDGFQSDAIRDIVGHMHEEVNRKSYTGKIEVDTSKYDSFSM